MKIPPYSHGRFKNHLEKRSAAFGKLLYQCQIHTRYFEMDEVILCQGEVLAHLYVVPAGRVSMSIIAANGRRFQLGETYCDYHIYGEMEYFTQAPCQWNVVADEALQVDIICLLKLTEMLHKHPEMILFFTSALAEDYQDSMAIYTHRLLHPITYNIAYDLLNQKQMAPPFGRFDKIQQEAERFGTTARVYRRAVKDLIDKGLINKTKQGLEVLDEDALMKFLTGSK